VGSRLIIRTPEQDERGSVERLALLDDRRTPEGELLVAEVDGELWAAVAIQTGDGVSDPFRPSDPVLSVLKATAAGLRATDADRKREWPARIRMRPVRRYLRRGDATALQPVHRAAA
jgi:hypothetical protein